MSGTSIIAQISMSLTGLKVEAERVGRLDTTRNESHYLSLLSFVKWAILIGDPFT